MRALLVMILLFMACDSTTRPVVQIEREHYSGNFYVEAVPDTCSKYCFNHTVMAIDIVDGLVHATAGTIELDGIFLEQNQQLTLSDGSGLDVIIWYYTKNLFSGRITLKGQSMFRYDIIGTKQ